MKSHGSWLTVWCVIGLALVFTSCSALGLGPSVRSKSAGPWGAASPVPGNGKDLLFGSGHWCVDDDEPATVTELRWQEIDGLEVVDFAIANHAADSGGVGLLHGTLEDEGLDSQTRLVEAPCDQPDDDDPQVSYVVLQVRLSDPSRVGRAKGLRLVADGSVSELDPMTIGVCPIDFGTCDDTTIE